MNICINCSKILTTNDIGLYKRLVSMVNEEYMCKECLAKRFNCDVSVLDAKIKQYVDMGCTLFELDNKERTK